MTEATAGESTTHKAQSYNILVTSQLGDMTNALSCKT